jgi:peptide/nickel transport system substrate-binding protein
MRPNEFRSRAAAGAGVLALALIAAGCSPAATTTTSNSDNGTVTELVSTLGNGLFLPREANEGPAGEDHLIFASLLTLSPSGQLEPGIAESWTQDTQAENWTFVIRSGLTFQNGAPITAADIAYTLENTYGPGALTDTNSTGAVKLVAKATTSITASAANTVKVVFSKPLPYFGYLMTNFLSGSDQSGLFPEAYFKQVGLTGFDQKPIGSGPMQLIDYVPGQSMTFQRFDGYYNKAELPHFKFLKVEVVPEVATRVEALIGGQADVVQAQTSVIPQLTGAGDKVTYSTYANYVFDQWQGCWVTTYACSNVQVREALDLALDKTTIMKTLFGASWEDAGWQEAMPGTLGYTPDLAPRPQNKAQAQQLLASAGYPGGKGMPTLVIDVISDSASIPQLPNLALLIAQEWKDVLGVNTDVRVSDFSSLDSRQGTGVLNGQFYIRDNTARYDGASLYKGSYSGDTTNPNNLTEDPALAAITQAMGAAVTPDSRTAAYNAAYEAARNAEYEIGFGSIANVWGTSSRIHGWAPPTLNGSASDLWTIQVSS